MGASFCHVNRIKLDASEMPYVNSCTQTWNKDIPNFMIKAIVISIDIIGLNNFVMVYRPETNRFIITVIMSNIDTVDYVKKYLVDASVAYGLNIFIIIGMMAAAKSLQSCPTLCDPVDGNPPGCSVPGILHARTLEWVAISFSNA